MTDCNTMLNGKDLPEDVYNNDVDECDPFNDDPFNIAEIAHEITENSRVVKKEDIDNMPKIGLEDLKIGDYLGSGAFSDVYGIKNITNEEKKRRMISRSKKDLDRACDDVSNDKCIEDYAIKCLSPEASEDEAKYQCAIADFLIEMHLLSSLNHPHIMKIRGISSSWFNTSGVFQNNSLFFIMDKLEGTLEDKITSWAKANGNSISNDDILLRSLRVASFDIASAMNFLHKKNIIYRDLKPANIGFDTEGKVKIFDFGLAREIPDDRSIDGTYQMTGMVGSPRYMAPEIVSYGSYNLTADVYSFGILLWEICSLKKPFDEYGFRSMDKFQKAVVMDRKRPTAPQTWPSSLRSIINHCWSHDIKKRPSFDTITGKIAEEINSITFKKEPPTRNVVKNNPHRRKSRGSITKKMSFTSRRTSDSSLTRTQTTVSSDGESECDEVSKSARERRKKGTIKTISSAIYTKCIKNSRHRIKK